MNSEKLEVSQIINPFSKFSRKLNINDIYSGDEKIPFKSRHPIFKCLLKIEFEDVMREYLKAK